MTWQKGQSGNPKGRKPGKYTVEDLFKAIREVEKTKSKTSKGWTLLKHFVQRASEDDKVLVALMRKILPDIERHIEEGAIQLLAPALIKKPRDSGK